MRQATKPPVVQPISQSGGRSPRSHARVRAWKANPNLIIPIFLASVAAIVFAIRFTPEVEYRDKIVEVVGPERVVTRTIRAPVRMEDRRVLMLHGYKRGLFDMGSAALVLFQNASKTGSMSDAQKVTWLGYISLYQAQREKAEEQMAGSTERIDDMREATEKSIDLTIDRARMKELTLEHLDSVLNLKGKAGDRFMRRLREAVK